MRFEKVSYEEYKSKRKGIPEEEIRKEYDNIKLPKRATKGSAGYDFYAPYEIFCNNSYLTVATGIRWVGDEDDCVLMLFPRSGHGFKKGLALRNTVGIIDSDYQYSDNEGHIMAKINSEEDFLVESGTAFMQGVMTRFCVTDDDDAKESRNGGFGSTDK